MPEKYLRLDEHAIHLLHTGTTSLPDRPPPLGPGPALVLVHAAGGNAASWQFQLAALGTSHTLVALDLPGHGRSSGVTGLPDLEAHAGLVGRVLEWLAPAGALAVGWGLGGAVCLALAARRAAPVRGLVLVATALRFDVPAELRAVLGDVVRGRRPQYFGTETFSARTDPGRMKLAWAEQVKTDPRVALADLELLARFDGTDYAAAVRVPTLVLAGADDRIAPVGGARALAEAIRDARIEVVSAAGHQVPLEQPARVSELLAGFAEGLA